jgi:hypothetical protein
MKLTLKHVVNLFSVIAVSVASCISSNVFAQDIANTSFDKLHDNPSYAIQAGRQIEVPSAPAVKEIPQNNAVSRHTDTRGFLKCSYCHSKGNCFDTDCAYSCNLRVCAGDDEPVDPRLPEQKTVPQILKQLPNNVLTDYIGKLSIRNGKVTDIYTGDLENYLTQDEVNKVIEATTGITTTKDATDEVQRNAKCIAPGTCEANHVHWTCTSNC